MPDSENLIRRQMAEQMQETFASGLNAVTWALLRSGSRSAADDEKMLYAAFASAYHYLETGSAAEQQRAEWLISRVYAVLGNGRESLRHAERCNALTLANAADMAEYDKAFALEALARANAVAGNAVEADKIRAQAEAAGKAIVDEQSRKVFMDELNWK
ncbi:MAG: hypothetical protein KDB90_07825 [Planctomycetes bacterium]|nr:hypothetical protein [Planctomycetota bacterium]